MHFSISTRHVKSRIPSVAFKNKSHDCTFRKWTIKTNKTAKRLHLKKKTALRDCPSTRLGQGRSLNHRSQKNKDKNAARRNSLIRKFLRWVFRARCLFKHYHSCIISSPKKVSWERGVLGHIRVSVPAEYTRNEPSQAAFGVEQLIIISSAVAQ